MIQKIKLLFLLTASSDYLKYFKVKKSDIIFTFRNLFLSLLASILDDHPKLEVNFGFLCIIHVTIQ